MNLLQHKLLHLSLSRTAVALILAASIHAAPAATNIVVNAKSTGAGSLRQTVVNSLAGDTILFDAGLTGQTIVLTNGHLVINKDLILDAAALPGGIHLSGNQTNRVLEITAGVVATLSSLTIRDGYAPDALHPANAGGGILNRGALTLVNCTVTNNRALQGFNAGGGGIETYGGTLTLSNCTIAGNASAVGGGIECFYNAVTLNQSTVAGNSATSVGGGIVNQHGTVTVNQSTVTGNSASTTGGGIANYDALTLFNSIVAGNFSSGNLNLFGAASPSGVNRISGNPLLAPLGNYGGLTPTAPPSTGSPAIDAAAPTPFTTDQRGLPRVTGAGPDIGAVEFQDADLIVTTNSDAGAGSLRDVIAKKADGGTITFAPHLSGTTLQLTSGELLLNKNHTIDASALPAGIQINGNGTFRILQVASGTTNVLNALTLTNGNGSGGLGGAIHNQGNLTLNRCTVAGNSAPSGGGIWNDGVLTVNQCTLFGNSASKIAIAAWTFETSAPTTAGPHNPEVGSGSATSFHAGAETYTSPNGNGSARSFSVNTWQIGDYFQFSVSTLGKSGLTVSWDQVSSATGPRDFRFSYSTDGTNFTQFGSNYVVVNNTGTNAWSTGTRIFSTSYTNDLSALTALNNRPTVYFRLVDVSITNTSGGTVAANGSDRVDNFAVTAGGGGGGLAGGGQMAVNQSTLTGNSSPDRGGGIANSGPLTLFNSIVAGNTAPTAANISGAFTGGVNLTNGAPLLQALGNYGGPTPTMPPLANSPAIDAGNDSAASSFATDQRGLPRLSGLHVDLGAAEFQVQVIIVTNPPVLTGLTMLSNGAFAFSFTNVTGQGFTVYASTNVALPAAAWSNLGAAVESPSGSGNFQFNDPQATNHLYRFYRVQSP